MATQRHEISLQVLKNISRVRPPFKLFYDEFKVRLVIVDTTAAPVLYIVRQ